MPILRHKTAVFIALFFLSINIAYGFDDGFSQAKEIQSEYFSIYCVPQLDISGLIQNLDVSPQDKILAGKPLKRAASDEEELADMVDVLFLQICNILDMHVYSFHGTIKVCGDYSHLSSVCNDLLGKTPKSGSLYVSGSNTIYIFPEYFNRAVLGHEIAHAVINRYFVVEPPERAAEILAGYVEYQLRKTIQKKP